ncbi:UDP-N-acetyl-D-glucosamine dehydrogenase [Evansella caseinilytica]|uniref:UDP-N-acetyl-D-glucosamine dehydrogenase n=1 Tax=Evansella caseinilytica TaxID=1503961 RepID=A0A1H3HM81_9BACI|nr:nucleotide sugar dehydrogenase [Evansella caseinilytica]SDY16601.1 UDP-N-acetyl-D-glucosamine dehydrogenase [Evansella caseinilytica]
MQKERNHFMKSVAIIGLGYVGLPLAKLFVKNGFHVTGIDIDKAKIRELKRRKSYITDLSDLEIEALWSTGSFEATDKYERVSEAGACIICVPTPLKNNQVPELRYLQAAVKSISPFVQKGQLIVLESSTFPGTTEEVVQPMLEAGGRKAGTDFFLGYSPERIDPGNQQYQLEDIPKVISGVTGKCSDELDGLYSRVFTKTIRVSSPKVAEMTKVFENTQRFINISFMNEIAMVCHEMDIDIWEVIEAAATKPFGFVHYAPGPGIGGHCIPVDPLYLSWKAKQYEATTNFIELSKNINDQMPFYVIERLEKLLAAEGKALEQAAVLLIGLTYKKDVNDIRDSSAVIIFNALKERGTAVYFHDPLFMKYETKAGTVESAELSAEFIKKQDCVVILTNHTDVPYDLLLKHAPLIFDTRNQLKAKHSQVKYL